MSGTNCPSQEELFAFLVGTLPEDAAEGLFEHVGSCGPCRARLETFDEADDTLVARLRCPVGEDPYAAEPQRRELLERAKAMMLCSRLPEAREDLLALVDELKDQEVAPDSDEAALLAESRAALANARYYMTWLMRLEGAPRDDWEPEIEAARQTLRALAEEAVAAGIEDDAQRHRDDLEASIRLARMDLSDLQGLPLPSQ